MRPPRLAALAGGLLLLGAAFTGLRPWAESAPGFGTGSHDAIAAFQEGEQHLRRYEWQPARDALERAVQADPRFALAHLMLARTCRFLGDRDGADAHLGLARTWADSTATEEEALRIRYEHAEVHRDEAARDDAFDQLVQRYPDRVSTLVLRAGHAKLAQEYDRAWNLFERALDADPSRVDLHNELGYVALELGRYEDAVTCLQRYAYYVPDAANPHDSLGEAYLHTGRYEESAREYLRALEIDPTFLSSAIGACDALRITGQLRAASQLLDTTEPLFLDRGLVTLLALKRTQLVYESENWPEVLETAEGFLRELDFRDPATRGHEMWLRAFRTLAHARSGNLAAARAQVDSCAQLLDHLRQDLTAPDTAAREDVELLKASLLASVAVYTTEDTEARLTELRRRIGQSTRRPHRLMPFRTVLAEALLLDGLYEETVEVAGATLAFNPRHPNSNLLTCKALLQRRQWDRALPYLETYLEVMRLADADHPEVEEARRILQKLAPSS